jgi:DNA-binding HxlR family transcriptional regulator/putative sterol carrier protein
MANKRSYDDGCAGAHALDLVGERWALLVVRELLLGPKRFTDLRASLPGISPNVLTQRLGELELASIVLRRRLPPPANVWVYALSDWGKELETIIAELGRWGARSPQLPRGAAMSADSLILSFRTMFDAQAAKGLKARYELRFGGNHYHAEIGGGRIELDRGRMPQADAVLDSDPDTLAALAYDGADVTAAIDGGRLRIDGDRQAAKRFLTLFRLPPPAPVLSA